MRQPAIDVERLRRERFARCLDAMERSDLDALVLGREANVRYVSDARRLWLAGARPFGPACVVVRATRQVHLLSTSTDGVPESIPAARLYPLSWNPESYVERLGRVPGLREARRVGVDGWNEAAGRLLARVAPRAEIADGEGAMLAARGRKTRDEVECISAAAGVASAGLEAVVAALRAGAGEAEMSGAFLERIALLGVTVPSFDRVVHPAVGPPLVALRCGVLRDGYEATLIRTWPSTGDVVVGPALRGVVRRWRAVRERLAGACRPRAAASDLLGVYAEAGEALPAFPIAHGIGLGCEPPVIAGGHVCDGAWRVEPGMVLALRAWVSDAGGSILSQDVVHVGADACEALTGDSYGPLGDG